MQKANLAIGARNRRSQSALAMALAIGARNRRSQSALAIGALVCLGCATQARADYVPTTVDWVHISSTAPAAVAANGSQSSHSGPIPIPTVKRTWNWQGGATPPPARLQLTFSYSFGELSVQGTSGGCSGEIFGGFTSAGAITPTTDDYNVDLVYSATAPNGYGNPVGGNTFAIKDYPGTRLISDTAYVGASTYAAIAIGGTATAGATTCTLSGFSLVPAA